MKKRGPSGTLVCRLARLQPEKRMEVPSVATVKKYVRGINAVRAYHLIHWHLGLRTVGGKVFVVCEEVQ